MSQGHVRQQGKGSWELKFDLGRDPLSGRRITKYATFRGTKRKAQEELTRLLAHRNEGTYVDPTKMTVAAYLRHWLEADIDRRVAARTAARHRGIAEKNITPKLGHIPIRKLTALHIEAFEAELQRQGWAKPRRKPSDGDQLEARGLSPQTVQHVHRTLSQARSHAVRLGVLIKNPAMQVKPPRPQRREIKILSKDEMGTLLKAAQGTWLHLPVLVALTTGLRRGELLGLRWSDLDLKAGTLTVNQSLERLKGKVTFKAPKTKTSQRSITVPTFTVHALQEHRATQAEERMKLGLGRDPRGLVFTRADGEPLDADSVTKAFGRLIAAIGVTPITLHGLRHTHISHLLMDGVHVKVVSERAGHANVNITLSVYAAYIPSMQADAALRVDAWLRVEAKSGAREDSGWELGGKSEL
jgi:integrase